MCAQDKTCTIKDRLCKDHIWNPSKCTCDCGKNCDICEYLKDCTSMESLFDDLVFTWDVSLDTLDTTWVSPSGKMNF